MNGLVKVNGDVSLEIFESGPDEKRSSAESCIVDLISGAKEKIWIETPYFVPSHEMFLALCDAVARGVEVVLLLPAMKDKLIVHNVTIFMAKKLLKFGAKVFLYNGFLHSKLILVDDEKCLSGTVNCDMRSLFLNFEICMLSSSKNLISSLLFNFENDKENSTQIKKKGVNFPPFFSLLFYNLL